MSTIIKTKKPSFMSDTADEVKADDVSVDATAIIAKGAELKGQVEIGPGCVIHPGAKIHGLGGLIKIGENCVVEEMAHLLTDPAANQGQGFMMMVGDNNWIQVGAKVECVAMGNGNVIEPKAVLKRGCMLGNGCIIGMKVVVDPQASVSDNTILFGPLASQRVNRMALADKDKTGGGDDGDQKVMAGEHINTAALRPRLEALRQIMKPK